MISTLQIQTALAAHLTALEAAPDEPLLEKVIAHRTADLGAALKTLRDTPKSFAVVVPGPDDIRHQIEEGTNTPVFAEIRNSFDLVISARDLAMPQDGVTDVLDFKDAVIAGLMWDDIGVDGLLTLPGTCEPVVLEFDGRTQGRDAWKLNLEVRQLITL